MRNTKIDSKSVEKTANIAYEDKSESFKELDDILSLFDNKLSQMNSVIHDIYIKVNNIHSFDKDDEVIDKMDSKIDNSFLDKIKTKLYDMEKNNQTLYKINYHLNSII
jgi:hypothetical protein